MMCSSAIWISYKNKRVPSSIMITKWGIRPYALAFSWIILLPPHPTPSLCSPTEVMMESFPRRGKLFMANLGFSSFPHLPEALPGKLLWAQNLLKKLMNRWITGIKKLLQAWRAWWAPAQVIGTPGLSEPKSDSEEQKVPRASFPSWQALTWSFTLLSILTSSPVPSAPSLRGKDEKEPGRVRATFKSRHGIVFPDSIQSADRSILTDFRTHGGLSKAGPRSPLSLALMFPSRLEP